MPTIASPAEPFVRVAGTDPPGQAVVASVVIALLNTAGALAVLVWRDPTDRSLDAALGFPAGVMPSAAHTSLLLPGIEFAGDPGYEAIGVGGVELVGIVPVLVGFGLGVVLLDRADAGLSRA